MNMGHAVWRHGHVHYHRAGCSRHGAASVVIAREPPPSHFNLSLPIALSARRAGGNKQKDLVALPSLALQSFVARRSQLARRVSRSFFASLQSKAHWSSGPGHITHPQTPWYLRLLHRKPTGADERCFQFVLFLLV